MTKIGLGLPTHHASPERDSLDALRITVKQLQQEPLLGWLDAIPMGKIGRAHV